MKRMTLAVLAGALLWAGYWVWQSRSTQAAVEDWFAARQADGWQASYSEVSVRGFPNRLDVTVNDVRLTDPDGKPVLDAPFLQVFQLIYNPSHRIIAFPPDMRVGKWRVGSEGLRASLVTDGALIDRANMEATVLNLSHPDRAFALAGVTVGAARAIGATYRIGAASQTVAGPDGGLMAVANDGFDIQVETTFDKPWPAKALSTDRPQPTRLDVRMFDYRLGTLRLKLAGALDVDTDGRGDGDLTLRAENWRALIDTARDAGQLPPALANTLTDGLSLYTRLQGKGDTLDLPLRFDAGRMMMGPIPLGNGPRFVLP